ncbi:hypothetical protein PR048_006694 [Dryococelus australis]|uniref:Uncharacterized protein n=1 Tax=Dryococelus australis TaxID=614101 RepID=A0ABQ9ICW8_9NEOP|nr:hypothetical protein PR048_006694 [Dryococelus australis]
MPQARQIDSRLWFAVNMVPYLGKGVWLVQKGNKKTCTRIVYERAFLMHLRNSPLARTPPSDISNFPSNLLKGALDVLPKEIHSVSTPPKNGEPGSIPSTVTGFLHVGIVPDNAVGRWVLSGISRFPRPFILAPLHVHFNHRIGSQDLAIKEPPKYLHSLIFVNNRN